MQREKFEQSPEITGLHYVVFWVAACLLMFLGLGDTALRGSEGRWAEITREMVLTGDFFHPTINGEAHFFKPLLTYWAILIPFQFVGVITEGVIRLPSAVAGLLVLGSTIYLGNNLWSKRIGLTAGWLLLSSYGLLNYSRQASAEMENLAAIMLAIAWYWSKRETPGFFNCLVFYLICAIGAQMKGLTAAVIPFLAVVPDLIRAQRWRILWKGYNLSAMSIGAAVYLAPFIYSSASSGSYQDDGLALAVQENIERFFTPFDHIEPFYVYLRYAPALLFPWIPLFVMSLWAACRRYRILSENSRWLLEVILIIFVFFTLSGSRRSYYILPIIPFCALLIANFVYKQEPEHKALAYRLQSALLILFATAHLLAVIIFPLLSSRLGGIDFHYLPIGISTIGVLALGAWLSDRYWPDVFSRIMGANKNISGSLVAALILLGGFYGWLQVKLDNYRVEKGFAQEVVALAGDIPTRDMAFYCSLKTNTLFYLNRPEPIQVLSDNQTTLHFLRSGQGEKIVITTGECLPQIQAMLKGSCRSAKPTIETPLFPWKKNNKRSLYAWKIIAGEQCD